MLRRDMSAQPRAVKTFATKLACAAAESPLPTVRVVLTGMSLMLVDAPLREPAPAIHTW